MEGVQARCRYVGNGAALVSLTNRTPYTLRDCAFGNSGATVSAGALAPGASVEKKIHWETGANGRTLALTGGPQPGEVYTDDPEDARNRIRYGLVSAFGQNGHAGLVERGFEAQVERDERLAPVIGYEQRFERLACRLPRRVALQRQVDGCNAGSESSRCGHFLSSPRARPAVIPPNTTG